MRGGCGECTHSSGVVVSLDRVFSGVNALRSSWGWFAREPGMQTDLGNRVALFRVESEQARCEMHCGARKVLRELDDALSHHGGHELSVTVDEGMRTGEKNVGENAEGPGIGLCAVVAASVGVCDLRRGVIIGTARCCHESVSTNETG